MGGTNLVHKGLGGTVAGTAVGIGYVFMSKWLRMSGVILNVWVMLDCLEAALVMCKPYVHNSVSVSGLSFGPLSNIEL